MTINPISYPISLPTTPDNPARARLVAATVVGVSRSPFTLETQTQKHGGQSWRMSYAMPPMELTAAEDWISKLLLLNGREKTFLLGDPANATPQGTAKGINLIPNSEDFSGWTLTNATITDGQTDPNSGSAADRFETTVAANSFMILESAVTNLRNTTLAGRTFTVSVYLKKISLATSDSISLFIRHNDATDSSSLVTNITTSWVRYSFSHTWADDGNDTVELAFSPASTTIGDQVDIFGLQVEEAAAAGTYARVDQGPQIQYRDNQILSSQIFDTTWTKSGTPVVTDNNGTAPDGTTTAALINDDDGAGNESILQNITIADDSTTWVFSFYVKEGTAAILQFNMQFIGGSAGTQTTTFTWSTHAVSGGGSPVAEDVGGGWWRISDSRTNDSSGNVTFRPAIFPAGTPNNTGTVEVWGAQLTNTALPINYVATTAASVDAQAPTSGDLVLYTDGWVPSSGVLNAGDYIQIGTGSTSRLHKVTSDVTSDAHGNAAIDIWPGLREVPSDNAVLYTDKPVGTFRLSANNQSWDINEAVHYGLGFDAEEAL